MEKSWNCVFELLWEPIGILGQVWYLIVSIPDLCNLTYFVNFEYIFDEICFTGDYHPTLDNNLKQFTKSVQQYIAFVTQVSPLRYQDPQITYTAGYTYYIGTMVEQAPYLCESFSY